MKWNRKELEVIEKIGPFLEANEIERAVQEIRSHRIISDPSPNPSEEVNVKKLLLSVGYILGPKKFTFGYKPSQQSYYRAIILYYPKEFKLGNSRQGQIIVSLAITNWSDPENCRNLLKNNLTHEQRDWAIFYEIIDQATWIGEIK